MAKVLFYLDARSKETEKPLCFKFFHKARKFENSSTINARLSEDSLKPGKFTGPEFIKGSSDFIIGLRDRIARIKHLLEIKIPTQLQSELGYEPNLREIKKEFLLQVNSDIDSANIRKIADVRNQMSFLEVFQTFIEYIQKHNNLAPCTVIARQQTLSLLTKYCKTRRTELCFEDIGIVFYDDFVLYLRAEYIQVQRPYKVGLGDNTVGSHIKIIKGFMNWANEHEYTTAKGHLKKHFKVIKKPSDIVAFTKEELKAVIDLEFDKDTEYLERSRDIIIAGCSTGLRISDLMSLRPEQIHFNAFNPRESFLEKTPKKTQKFGRRVKIPITTFFRDVIKKYEGKYETVLPTHNSHGNRISPSRFNKEIKKIALLAGIDAVQEKQTYYNDKEEIVTKKRGNLFTAHRMRATFITLMLTAGIPAHIVMKMSGHTNWASFQKYIVFVDKQNIVAMETFDDFLTSSNDLLAESA